MSARVGEDEHRIRLRLHYDGGAFAGWQAQREKRTVQGELEAALEQLTTAPVRVIAAGRTDSGVHATGQVVSLKLPKRWSAAELRRALNAVLPFDVWVAEATGTDEAFHARYSAIARGYIYRVGTREISQSPFARRYCWPLGETLPLELLGEAAQMFLGDHSFRAFAKSGQPQRGERCIVHRSEWRESGGHVTYHVVANRFLHHMVRYMVGTMVEVALRRRDVADITRMLAADTTDERSGRGPVTSRPAPPQGLYLTRVFYQGDDWIAGDAIDEILS